MTTRIYKHVVPITGDGYDFGFRGPIVHVGQQGNPYEVVVWVEDNPELPAEAVSLTVVGTGHVWPQDHAYKHYGTVQNEALGLVWHLLGAPA